MLHIVESESALFAWEKGIYRARNTPFCMNVTYSPFNANSVCSDEMLHIAASESPLFAKEKGIYRNTPL